jgi:hypothetical protein
MNEPQDDDDPRDAHLLAALRHAPDRDALPPREVSERILAAARAAVRPARAAPWWQGVGAWLVQPQVAASFGTLVVASIVGLMWSTREPPAEPALRPSAAEQAAATSAMASAAAPATAPSEPRRDERDLFAVQTTPAAPAPKQETAPGRAKEATAPAAKVDARPAPVAAPKPFAESVDGGRVAAAPAAAPAERLEQARGADAAVSADTAKTSRPRVAAASMPALELSSRQALGAAGNAAAVTDPLVRIDALLAGGDASWSNAGRALPHGPAQAAWWAHLRRATAGAWQPALPTRADAAALSSLTLRVAGQGIASFDFAAGSAQWCAADRNACWRAPITAAQREAWIAEVARW